MSALRRGFPGEKCAPKYVKRISIQAKLGSISENRSLKCFNNLLRSYAQAQSRRTTGSISLKSFEFRRPLVVGIGGTTRAASSTERALRVALNGAEAEGARTRLFGGTFLHSLPHYAPEHKERTEAQIELIEAVREADAVIIGTPGYHGGVSGLVKNALDTLEELRDDRRPYLDGRAVGCVVTAYGWQGGGAVLTSLRSIVHALRGWPTPYGAAVNSLETQFETIDTCSDPKVADQLATVGRQAAQFALAFNAREAIAELDTAR
jgi:FMN reductase